VDAISQQAAIPAPAPVHVVVLGLRGIVGVEGGIETHARYLYPLIARMGCRVEVLQRSPYYRERPRRREWHGVTMRHLWAPTLPGLETAVHSLLGVLYAAVVRADVVHLHAVGPGLLAPFARLLGLRVVFTMHAEDYRREKWGPLAKWVLKAGERYGMRFAHRRIVVSPLLRQRIQREYGVEPALLPNGAPRVIRARSTGALETLGLELGRYVLCVARIDLTKRQADLIAAFERCGLPGWKLVLVGAVDPRNRYCASIIDRVRGNPNIVLAGFQKGRALRELYTHCGLFVLPSSLEGHPIALLEALSYGLPVLASDIPENAVIPMPNDRFFPVGDVAALARLMESATRRTHDRGAESQRLVKELYSWRRAARATADLYHDLSGGA
jgi:glycosyltransferase involved in cell wall biosynthesis